MSYAASVYKVMIASPSDVAAERHMIRDVVHEWNTIHAEDKGIVLMPIGWETHASPDFGDRPQEIINKQVLADADLLVAAFWTRIGSPTGKSPSGTIEEIEEHIAAGKPAMVYFSSAPVHPDSVDTEQYKALREFKQECFSRGLVEEYDSVSVFREKFSRQLAQSVLRNFARSNALDDGNATIPINRPIVPELGNLSQNLIKEIAQDRNGRVLRVRSNDGLSVVTNNRDMVETKDPRTEARWDSAVQELIDQALIQDVGYKGEVFAITERGYTVADSLREKA